MNSSSTRRGDAYLAIKSGFWYLMSTFITKGLSFLVIPLFARLLIPSAFGEFSNFVNWQSLLTIVIGLEMYSSLSVAFYDYRSNYDRYASSIAIMGTIIAIIIYILALKYDYIIFKILSIPPQYVHLMIFAIIFQNIKQVFLIREKTLYHYKSVSIISLLSLVVPTIISMILVLLCDESQRLDARIYGFFVPYGLIGVYCAYDIFRKNISLDFEYVKYAVIIAFPLLVHHLTTYILLSTNTIVTKNLLGSETAAIVSITMSLMNIILLLFQAANGAMTTWIMDCLESQQYSKIENSYKYFFSIASFITLCVILLAPEIVMIIGGAKYVQAINLIPGFALSMLFQVFASTFIIILTYQKSIKATALLSGVIAILGVVIKIVYLQTTGIEILPIINIISFGVLFVGNLYFVVKNGFAKCINVKHTFLLITAIFSVCLFAENLYNNIIRYIIILLLLIFFASMVINNKDKMIRLYKTRQ